MKNCNVSQQPLRIEQGLTEDVQEKVKLAAEIFEKYSNEIRATIRFNVPEAASAKVTFYDVTGQQAGVLLDENVHVLSKY